MANEHSSKVVDMYPVFMFLEPRGRYQVWQMVLISLGGLGSQYQLYSNIFIGKEVPFRCAPPSGNLTETLPRIDLPGNISSHMRYEECKIVVTSNHTEDIKLIKEESFDCLYGYNYEWRKDASFMSEFDMVCGSDQLLVSLSQTLVVLGQGVGAFVTSIFSDRFGRKRVLVGSQLGLLTVGAVIGASPSYLTLAILKFVVGTFQQGVVTTMATMGMELFPHEHRALCGLLLGVLWGVGVTTLGIFGFLLRHSTWRVLQYSLSGASFLIALLQLFFVEESLYWLVANGKTEKALRVLSKAARVNKKDEGKVIATLHSCQFPDAELLHAHKSREGEKTTERVEAASAAPLAPLASAESGEQPQNDDTDAGEVISLAATRKLTLLDMFRNKTLRVNALLTFNAWFTVAFVTFTLFFMSGSLAGDPYVNFTLMALMHFPPPVYLFFCVDKLGRKRTVQTFYVVAGLGCIISSVSKFTSGNTLVSTAFSVIGILGSMGAFCGLFFYVPELFPTNFRNQAVGTGSAVGRVGGMLAPFMKNLAKVVLWGPGAIAGALCVSVVICLHFLPETKGKELPMEIQDIEAWYSDADTKKGGSGQVTSPRKNTISNSVA